MPTIELDPVELIKLQTKLKQEEISPSEYPSMVEWNEIGGDPEAYVHEVGLDTALEQILNACPICGSTTCDRGIAYVGSTPIHRDQHPEVKAERAMDNQGRGRL